MSFPVDTSHVPRRPAHERSVEIVERKGLGHPDTLSDGVAEAVSRALSRRYLDEFGRVLHHNTDSVQMVAGNAEPSFGGGEVAEPPTVYLGGQATVEAGGTRVPVAEIAEDAARRYVDRTVERLSGDDLEVVADIDEASGDLRALFERDVPSSNDTSVGVGYAPLSEAERVVREVEPEVRSHDAVGEDVKVMGVRKDGKLSLTVAAAVVADEVADTDDYVEAKESVRQTVVEHAREHTDDELSVVVNAADDLDAGDVYLTVTGLSVEDGDDGAVGRGNRPNGLIVPHRPMSIEAVAGKNPVTHVGKLYNLLARDAAERVADETGGYAEVSLVSEIGAPVDKPAFADVKTTAEDEPTVAEAVRDAVGRVDELTQHLVKGNVRLF